MRTRGRVEKQARKVLRSALTHQMVAARSTLSVIDATRVLNDELQQTFQRWHPGMQTDQGELKEVT
jgi:hypothetical protein